MKKLKAVESEAQGEAALDSKALEAIGRALKAHYDDLVQAPLPEKFVELLSRLEEKEQRAETKEEQRAGARKRPNASE